MAAPAGNQFWRARTRHGAIPKFPTGELLWSACEEYFDWVEQNPLWEEKGFAFQGVVTKETFHKMRAMTIGGLCLFLGIDRSTWTDWKTTDGLSTIVAQAEEVIRNQKFEGAAAELLNPNIIARDLGLRDETKVEHAGKVDYTNLTESDIDARIAALLNGK